MILVQSTILVVDDELFFRKLYSDLLSEEGYLVEVCENGDDAISRIVQGKIDLLLTDMVMPGKSGLEVLRAAREVPNPPEVILVTGHASLESAIQALKNGARDYLVKPFNPEELKHLVHNCLEQRRLLAENDSLKKQIQLFQTGQTLSSLIDLERLIPQSLDALLRAMGGSIGCGFTVKCNADPCTTTIKGIGRQRAERLVGLVLAEMDVATGLCQLNSDLQQRLGNAGFKAQQLWLLPLGDSAELKGGLLICDAAADLQARISSQDLRYLCDQIELGFENACRYQDAQELMYTDDLTGLYNHRFMQVAMSQEIRRSQRYGLQFSLVFLDLDKFKLINDTHGHLAGSAALQEVGVLLRRCVRNVDTLFRFGGDEFAALLVETDARTARIIAERIRKTIDEHIFLTDRQIPCRLTATAGFATYPTDALEKEALLHLADRAMYVGKIERNVIRGVEEIPDK
jgi:diguanylate cyclase (GGDEF)-like protein